MKKVLLLGLTGVALFFTTSCEKEQGCYNEHGMLVITKTDAKNEGMDFATQCSNMGGTIKTIE